jgi:hypothetical protein
MGRHRWRVSAHGAKFWHPEYQVVAADSIGPIEDRAFGSEANDQGDGCQGKEENQRGDDY